VRIKYYEAIHLLRLSEDENITEAGKDIERFVDELDSQLRRACASSTTFKLQRDIERAERKTEDSND
jgi:hypothetical protein